MRFPEDRNFVAAYAVQSTAVGSNPDASITTLKHRQNPIARQTLRHGVLGGLPADAEHAALFRAHPKVPIAIHHKSRHAIVEASPAFPVGDQLIAAQLAQAAAGSYPQVSVAIANDGVNHLSREFVPRRDALEFSILKPDQAPQGCADPQRTVGVGVQSLGIAVAKRGSVLPIEHLKLHSVKADEPLLSSKPEVAVLGLCDGLNGVLRETILNLPDIMGVHPQGLGGIDRHRGSRGGVQHCAAEREPSRDKRSATAGKPRRR